MSEDLDTLLTELESVTSKLASDDDASLETLTALGERRGALIGRLAGHGRLGAAAGKRVGAILRTGAEAECRAVRLRDELRRRMAELERTRSFTNGLASLLPGAGHDLDTRA